MANGPVGDSPGRHIADNLRRLRELHHFTLAQLADVSGVAPATLSRIEAGDANPRLETLWALATTLGIPLGELVAPSIPRLEVTRADHAPVLEGESVTARLLHQGQAGTLEIYTLDVSTRRQESAGHAPGTSEQLTCTQGRIRCGLLQAPVVLAPGDHLSFAATEPHLYQAIDRPARAVLVMSYQR